MLSCCTNAAVGPAGYEYIIVGGGTSAGYACKEFVAQKVAAGSVAMVMGEAHLPYERPALTKAYLHPAKWGETTPVRARLPGFHTCVGTGGARQEADWYLENGIELIRGQATVDIAAKTVQVGSQTLQYNKLILATGCEAVKVDRFGVKGGDLANVFYVREEKEAGELVKALEAFEGRAAKAVIVGGGFIGVECAAALAGWGLDVTVVFPETHVMSRVLNRELAKWLEDEMSNRGIKMFQGSALGELVGEGGTIKSVTFTYGENGSFTEPCDIAILGVGATPRVDCCPGLDVEQGGWKVNGMMQTSNPDVYAIGDVCCFPSKSGQYSRHEHVDHARKSAEHAVQAILGAKTEPYQYLPYFYSRIFEYTDQKIVFNMYGNQSDVCKVFPRGDSSVAAIWLLDGKVQGALLMGKPGPSPEDQQKLMEMILSAPAAEEDAPEKVFEAAGL